MVELPLHLVAFAAVGVIFLALPLLIGRFLRPRQPTPEKSLAYECGEVPIGSSDVRFDSRYYVVALVFLVFDVELALLFPWATVYGNSVQLADTTLSEAARGAISARMGAAPGGLVSADQAISLASVAFVEFVLFFGLLGLGFAYLWQRGDLDWVHTLRSQQPGHIRPPRRP
jgi:NADH-quinone oxidoreductase subunit A